MQYLLNLFRAGLMFCLTAAASLATPEQAEIGWVHGFTGLKSPVPEMTGDYLTGTYCYCEYSPTIDEWAGLGSLQFCTILSSLTKARATRDIVAARGPLTPKIYFIALVPCLKSDADSTFAQAHYFQIEYYNFHLNRTFILTHTCPKDNIDLVYGRCVPMKNEGDNLLAGSYYTMQNKLCRHWEGETFGVPDNKLCYRPYRHHGVDFIYFNQQKRSLGQDGGQGPVWQDQLTADDACGPLCRTHVDGQILKDEEYPQSHQVTWTSMDDMCDTCD